MAVQTEINQRSVVWARWAYCVLAYGFAAAIVVQVFLVGLSIFLRPVYWAAHVLSGHISGGFVLVLLAVALIGRLPRRFILGAVGLLGLMFIQYNIFTVAQLVGVPALSALHAVNALALFALALALGRAGWQQAHI